MAQQRVTDMTMPAGISAAGSDYSYSGQAGGNSGSVFGDLGGPGQQHGDGPGLTQDGSPRNQWGVPTGNPSGDASEDTGSDISDAPPMGSVFGDLGGGGVACQTGGQQIPAAPASSDPGGQGGR